jgi:hypothetical protein
MTVATNFRVCVADRIIAGTVRGRVIVPISNA